MKTVLFLYFSIDAHMGIHQGIAALAGVARSQGWYPKLLTITVESDIPKIVPHIEDHTPDLIAVSLIETQVQYFERWLPMYLNGDHSRKTPLIIGGPYVSMSDIVFTHRYPIDGYCKGEGEVYIRHVMNQIDRGYPFCEDGGCGISLPSHISPAALDLFPLSHLIQEKGALEMTIGRGCGYSCSYCINRDYMKKFGLKPKEYIRLKRLDIIKHEFRSVESISPKIYFVDDDFLTYDRLYPQRMREFYLWYESNVNLPFRINTNPLSVTADALDRFWDAGGREIRIGIESGSAKLRKTVLNRPISDHHLREAITLIQGRNISLDTYNLIGIPQETILDVHQTFQLNARYRPAFVKVMTFYPFKGTKLYDECEAKGLIDHERKRTLSNYTTTTCLKYDALWIMYLNKVQVCFDWFLNAMRGGPSEWVDIVYKVQKMGPIEWDRYKKNDLAKDRYALHIQAGNSLHYEKITKSVAKLIGVTQVEE